MMKQEQDWQAWRKRGVAVIAALAIASMFALTCFSIYLDRTATASVAAAMTLALILVRQLHVMESFEILSLKAKFTARVGEAEQLLRHIRGSASVSAKLSYVQLAIMNRMGDIGWHRKRGLLAEVDDLLRDVNVPESEISVMKAPFLNLVSLDLSRVFEHSLHELVRDKGVRVGPLEWEDPLGNPDLRNLRQVLTARMATLTLDETERQTAELIFNEVTTLSESCWSAGTITSEAENYLELYYSRTSARLDALKQATKE